MSLAVKKIKIPTGFSAKVLRTLFFGTSARLEIYEMLSSLVSGGTPLDVAIQKLCERKAEKKRPIAWILKKWSLTLGKGISFHEAVKDEVPSEERLLLSISNGTTEDSRDNFSNMLDQVVYVVNSKLAIRGVLVKEMLYPIMLLIAAGVMLVGFAVGLAPDYARMVPESKWTGMSGNLLHFSQFLEKRWIAIVVVIILLIGFISYQLPRWIGRVREKLAWLPILSTYRTYHSSIYLIGLSSMMRVGQPLDVAIKKLMIHANPYLKSYLSQTSKALSIGTKPGVALDNKLLEENVADQIHIFSQTTDFSKALKQMGERALVQGIKRIGTQAAFLRVISLATVGGIILWIILSTLDMNSQMASDNANSSNAAAVK